MESYVEESSNRPKAVMNATQYVKTMPGSNLIEKAISFWGDDMHVYVFEKSDGLGNVRGKPIWIVSSGKLSSLKKGEFITIEQQGRRIGGMLELIDDFDIKNPPSKYKSIKSATIYTFK